MPTAFELAQVRDVPLSQGVLAAVRMTAPAFSSFDARTSASKRFKTLSIVGLPDPSSFTTLGRGFKSSKGALALREFDCSLIGGMVEADTLSMREWDRDAAPTGYNYFDLQTTLKTKSDTRNIEKQIFDGTGNDALGFPGLKAITPFQAGNTLALTDTAEDTDYTKSVLNAGGTTDGAMSSVYSVVMGELDCQLIFGAVQGEGELFQFGEIRLQYECPDPVNAPDEKLEIQMQQIHGFVGLVNAGFNQQTPGQPIPTQYSVRRAANVGGNAPLNDTIMNMLNSSHPDEKMGSPRKFYMSRRSGQQLANSRAATSVAFFMGMSGASAKNASGNLQPPPPDNWEGIPIVYTWAIKNNNNHEA